MLAVVPHLSQLIHQSFPHLSLPRWNWAVYRGAASLSSPTHSRPSCAPPPPLGRGFSKEPVGGEIEGGQDSGPCFSMVPLLPSFVLPSPSQSPSCSSVSPSFSCADLLGSARWAKLGRFLGKLRAAPGGPQACSHPGPAAPCWNWTDAVAAGSGV